MDFIKELRWRGMIQDVIPGTEELLAKEKTTGYAGFDPTADSLHIGSLVPLGMLRLFKSAGHHPIAVLGGATAMVGDPSGKSEERKLLDEETITKNTEGIKEQITRLLNKDGSDDNVEILNNYDWFGKMTTLEFLRDVGKYLTVSYLLSKGYIKERLKTEISFTEFNYALIQAYDWHWLVENKNCVVQMGGSDQWGNITAGTELIRKKTRKNVFGVTAPLITKADGSKFGKTEEGNIWLDRKRTSPYKFYQFWMNTSDEDAYNYVKIFTLLTEQEVEDLKKQHDAAPHERILQSALAKEVTTWIHSEKDYELAVKASEILFGNATTEALRSISEADLLSICEGVPQKSIPLADFEAGMEVISFLADSTNIFPSRGEVKRSLKEGGISINKEKVQGAETTITSKDLLNNKYLLVQKGKKNYFLVIAE
ncbi:MAG: tyrosine--tRNA ligase [Bacteroidetes bacterium]|nr:tyrosine--tRNA ligase [Bacteroidota bacterium]